MSQRRNHRPNTKQVTCNKCLNTAVSVPNSIHRRCPGQPEKPIRDKHQGIDVGARGRWE